MGGPGTAPKVSSESLFTTGHGDRDPSRGARSIRAAPSAHAANRAGHTRDDTRPAAGRSTDAGKHTRAGSPGGRPHKDNRGTRGAHRRALPRIATPSCAFGGLATARTIARAIPASKVLLNICLLRPASLNPKKGKKSRPEKRLIVRGEPEGECCGIHPNFAETLISGWRLRVAKFRGRSRPGWIRGLLKAASTASANLRYGTRASRTLWLC